MGIIVRLPVKRRLREVKMSPETMEMFFDHQRLRAAQELVELEPTPANKARLLKARLEILERGDGDEPPGAA